MNYADVVSCLHNTGEESLVWLSQIKTQEDIEKYQNLGYLPNFTFADWQEKYPKIDANKICFLNGVNMGSFYFDGCIWMTVPVLCDLEPNFLINTSSEKFQESFLSAIQTLENHIENQEYEYAFMAPPDGMKPVIFYALLDKYGPTAKLYDILLDVYTTAESRTEKYNDLFMVLAPVKNKTQKDRTAALWREAAKGESRVRVWRGAFDGSTPVNKATSWTLDVNIALFFSGRTGGENPVLYSGYVPQNAVTEIISTEKGTEQEIIVKPGLVEDITEKPLLHVLSSEIEGLIYAIQPMYQTYRSLLALLYEKREHDLEDHSIKHSMRVLFHSLLLAEKLGMPTLDKVRLAEASIFHDVGRKTGAAEPEHGKASAAVYGKFGGKDRVVEFLIRNHCENEASVIGVEAKQLNDAKNAVMLLKVLKSADALDRVRFSYLSSDWVNADELDLKEAVPFVPFAMDCARMLQMPKDDADEYREMGVKDALSTIRIYFQMSWNSN